MKKMIFLIAVIVLLVSSAQAAYNTPEYGGFVTDVNVPKIATESEDKELKSAEGSYFSFFQPLSIIPGMGMLGLWLFSVGDGSIDTIAERSNIKKVHHVEERTRNFTFLWQWFEMKTYKVYGS